MPALMASHIRIGESSSPVLLTGILVAFCGTGSAVAEMGSEEEGVATELDEEEEGKEEEEIESDVFI